MSEAITQEQFKELSERVRALSGTADAIKINSDNWKEVEKKIGVIEETQRQVQETLRTRTVGANGEEIDTQKRFSLPGLEDEFRKGVDGKRKREFFLSQMVRFLLHPEHPAYLGLDDKRVRSGSDLAIVRDVAKEAKARDMAANIGPSGGFLVPQEATQPTQEFLTDPMILRAIGATFLSFTGSPVPFPKITGGQTAQYIPEHGTIPTSDVTLEQVVGKIRKVTAATKMSNEFLKFASPGTADQVVRDTMLTQMGLLWELMAFEGDNSGDNPLGIFHHPDTLKVAVGADGDTFDYAFARKLRLTGKQGKGMSDANGKNAWVMPSVLEDKILGFSGGSVLQYPLDPSVGHSEAIYDQKLFRKPVYTLEGLNQSRTKGSGTNLSSIYYGDFRKLYMLTFGSMEVLASGLAGTAFLANQTWMRGVHYNDVVIPQGKALLVATHVVTA